jgi:chromosome segregation ATPase
LCGRVSMHVTLSTPHSLRFLNAQKTRQVHSQEVHIAQLKTRLNNILEGKLTFNKETFESTYRATEAPLTEQKSVDRARVDLYHVSEANRQLLQGEVARFAEVERGYQEELEALQGTIGRRDEEIARLSGALSSERSWDKLTQEYNLDIKEKEIVNLHARIDFLNQEKERVQGDVRAYEEHGATQANLDLLKSKNSEIEDLTERWSIAQSTVARLETELKRLASAEALKLSNEQEVAKQVSIRVRAKDQEINALKGEYDALLLNVEQKNAECLRVTQQLRDLQISNDAYTSQRASDAAQAKIDSLNLQVSSSTNRLDSALQSEEKSRTRVMDLEQAARKQSKQFRLEMDSLRNELQQALDLNKSIIHKYKSLSATRVGADAERARLEDDLALTGQSADGIAQERDYFKGETSRLNAALVQLKQSQVEAEANLLKLHTHARGVGVEAESLREERASLNEEVNKYSLQVKQLHDKFIGSEAEVTRLSAMLNDVGQVADKASDAMEEANVTGVAFRKLQRRYEELEHKLGMVTKERMALGQRLETATQERNQLAVVVKDFDIKVL